MHIKLNNAVVSPTLFLSSVLSCLKSGVIFVVTMIYLLVVTTDANAGDTSIPFWQANKYTHYTLFLRNISDTPAEVVVQLFNQDGSVYSGNYQTSNDSRIDQAFILPAKSSSWVWVQAGEGSTVSSRIQGFGRIESRVPEEAEGQPRLMAWELAGNPDTDYIKPVPLNGGMWF